MTAPRPLLVVGAPRSGTTLIGTILGSAAGTCDLGEYAGYDFCHRLARDEMANLPGAATADYLRELQEHAHAFPRRFAAGQAWFVASAPWNLLVAREVGLVEPQMVFVLCLRPVQGVCQSLERSHRSGREWAGGSLAERIDLWCRFYSNVRWLPPDRTVLVDYEELCARPRLSWERAASELEGLGFPAYSCDLTAFARSHATEEDRPKVAALGPGGDLIWRSRPCWDEAAWSPEDERTLREHRRFQETQAILDGFLGARSPLD